MSRFQRLRAFFGSAVVLTVWAQIAILSAQNPTKGDAVQDEPRLETGEEIYLAACANCHGVDGKGAPRSSVAFDTRLPNFTDCAFATKEPDADWSATIHNGGPARGFSRIMPSFREALTDEQIDRVIGHLRGFCQDKSWPQGDLNLPRAMITEKAFPENETVITTAFQAEGTPGVSNIVTYERRIGSRNMIEAVVPFNFAHDTGTWVSGLGDLAFGYKRMLASSMKTGSIFSVGGEVAVPTGDPAKALGAGSTIFEMYAAYGQILPWDSFVQFQTGTELPAHPDQVPRAYYARTAIGKSLTTGGGLGRAWTPMVEFIADRDFETGAKTNWDILPQLQIPISKRMHILASIGGRIPINNTIGRPMQVMFYLLWDYADGSLRQGW
jgi:mono/diheme cytochrome c family protein